MSIRRDSRLNRDPANEPISPHQDITPSCLTNPHFDINEKIFDKCLLNRDSRGVLATGCASKSNHQSVREFLGLFLKKNCPRLNILDAKTLGFEVDDESFINKFKIFEHYNDFIQRLPPTQDLHLVSMCEGVTVNELIGIAKRQRIEIKFSSPDILKELGDDPIMDTYLALMTEQNLQNLQNSVITHQEMRLKQNGCTTPTVLELLTLCIFANNKNPYGPAAIGFGRSLKEGRQILLVGSDSNKCIHVQPLVYRRVGEGFYNISGVGGVRRFF